MRHATIRHVWWLLASTLLACGGGSANRPTAHVEDDDATPETAQVTSDVEPVESDVESDVEPDVEPEPAEEPAVVEAEPEEPESEPVAPITPSSAEDLHQALLAASNDEAALLRLIDPAWGVGTYDSGESGVVHHCDATEFAHHPGLSFAVREGDRFRCDRELRRCSSADPDGGGYVFHFRSGEGEAVWLSTIVHHQRQVPSRDSGPVRRFVEGGDGVCALRTSLEENGETAPARFSVFVHVHTGLVEDTLDQHLCGDEARAAYAERALPRLSGSPRFTCTRGPVRCSFRSGDEEITFYGAADGATGIAVTRPGMHRHLDREQERARDAFLRNLSNHTCDE